VLDKEEYWTALAAPDLAVLPYRVVSQSGTFNSCATQELPVLANDVDYFRRIEAEWGVPVTVDTENLSLLVERVRSLIEDDTRLEQLSGDHGSVQASQQLRKDWCRPPAYQLPRR